MGCGSCGNKSNHNERGMFSKPAEALARGIDAGRNIIRAGANQPDKVKWFKDGLTGIMKCLEHKTIYTTEEISRNRDKCRNCEFATKTNGKLTNLSQCMYPDPSKNGAPCGCFIMCKTQSDKCPKGEFAPVNLTIKQT